MNISRREWFAAAAAGIMGAGQVASGPLFNTVEFKTVYDQKLRAAIISGDSIPVSWVVPAEWRTTPAGKKYLLVTGYPHSPQLIKANNAEA